MRAFAFLIGCQASQSGSARSMANAIAVQVRPLLNGIHLTHDGFGADARVYTRREAELAQLIPEKKPPAGSNVLRCSMPGLVKAIPVIAGQAVRTGETLCIIEAMKMETAVCAEFDAMVAKIHVQPGDILASDAIIMTFEIILADSGGSE